MCTNNQHSPPGNYNNGYQTPFKQTKIFKYALAKQKK